MPWQIESLNVTGSTNDVARERVLALWQREQRVAGLVVTAQEQTGGRGQHRPAVAMPSGRLISVGGGGGYSAGGARKAGTGGSSGCGRGDWECGWYGRRAVAVAE